MNKITCKVASRGEGKTKWLLNIAKQYHDEGKKVYFFTEDSEQFISFCEKYFKLFSEICHVERLIDTDVDENAVVLMDDVFSHNIPTNYIYDISVNCYKLFITVDAALAVTETKVEYDPNQIRLNI